MMSQTISETPIADVRPAVTSATTRQPRPKRRINRREALAGYLFILPSIIGFSVFVLYPFVSSIYYALTKWDGIADPKFTGLDNFVYMFTKDPTFWKSIGVTLAYILMTVPSTVAAGLLLAVLVNRALPGIRIIRTILYLPVILPVVATLTLWKFIFNPQFGIANAILEGLHLPTSLWLSSEQAALPTFALINLWTVGGTMIIFLAALQSVPSETV